jgi:hypothetical protein
LLLPFQAVNLEGMPELPEGMATHHVMSVDEVAQRLAVAFYGAYEQRRRGIVVQHAN